MGMTTRSANKRDWANMPNDLLVRIFTMINALDRLVNVARVCQTWRSAASDETLNETLDIAECRTHLKPRTPKRKAKLALELAFVRGINLSRCRLTTLILDPSLPVTDWHLQYASPRCPNLQNLVLPYSNATTEACMERAFQLWRNLESFQMPYNDFLPPTSFFMTIGSNCPNLRVLKISCLLYYQRHIKIIAKYMPRLRVICVRCAVLEADVVEAFSDIQNLEEVYLSIINCQSPEDLPNVMQLPSLVNETRQRRCFPSIRVFHICFWDECNTCMAAIMGGNEPMNIRDPNPRSLAYIPFLD